MDFVFVCPETQILFETDDFSVINNQGVQMDADGNKYLDATVTLNSPCTLCGKVHSYPARDLACPFLDNN